MRRGARAGALIFVALESMPCGCVSAVYRARPTFMEFELVEAKGPHCRFFGHRAGHVIALGTAEVPGGDGSEPEV